MKEFLKISGAIVGIIIAIMVFGFGTGLYDLGMKKFFMPRVENVKRETYENTQSFSEGKLQDLAKYYLEYQKGDEQSRAAIKTVVSTQFAYFDKTKVKDPVLYSFLVNMRGF